MCSSQQEQVLAWSLEEEGYPIHIKSSLALTAAVCAMSVVDDLGIIPSRRLDCGRLAPSSALGCLAVAAAAAAKSCRLLLRALQSAAAAGSGEVQCGDEYSSEVNMSVSAQQAKERTAGSDRPIADDCAERHPESAASQLGSALGCVARFRLTWRLYAPHARDSVWRRQLFLSDAQQRQQRRQRDELMLVLVLTGWCMASSAIRTDQHRLYERACSFHTRSRQTNSQPVRQ